MQAIQTKTIGPTNYRDQRVKATCAAGSLTYVWQDNLDIETNHKHAANNLRDKLGWLGQLIGGTLKDGSMVWVFATTI